MNKIPEKIRHLALHDMTNNLRLCGVYFICRETTVLYVGQSVNPYRRVCGHMKGRFREVADSAYLYPCGSINLKHQEEMYIRALNPQFNFNSQYDKLIKLEDLR